MFSRFETLAMISFSWLVLITCTTALTGNTVGSNDHGGLSLIFLISLCTFIYALYKMYVTYQKESENR